MKNEVFLFLLLIGAFLTAVSQILLKASAYRYHKKWIYKYLNWRVILSYFLFFGIMLLNIYIFTGLDLKYGSVVNASSYVFVIVLAALFFKEKMNRQALIGNLFIVLGIVIYTLK